METVGAFILLIAVSIAVFIAGKVIDKKDKRKIELARIDYEASLEGDNRAHAMLMGMEYFTLLRGEKELQSKNKARITSEVERRKNLK